MLIYYYFLGLFQMLFLFERKQQSLYYHVYLCTILRDENESTRSFAHGKIIQHSLGLYNAPGVLIMVKKKATLQPTIPSSSLNFRRGGLEGFVGEWLSIVPYIYSTLPQKDRVASMDRSIHGGELLCFLMLVVQVGVKTFCLGFDGGRRNGKNNNNNNRTMYM